MKFYGRDNELALLRETERRSAESAQLTVMSGRKRIGKTTLLRHAYGEADRETAVAYLYVGNKNELHLCDELSRIARNWLGIEITAMLEVDEQRLFTKLIEAIISASAKRQFTLILDECQNLINVNDGIFGELAKIWRRHCNNSHINMVMCGSSHAMMTRVFDMEGGEMHGLATCRMMVQPFRIETLKEILADHSPQYTPEDLLAFCMITGGVARYVEELVAKKAFDKDSIIRAVLCEDSYFLAEGRDMLMDELGRDADNYFSILSAIAEGNTSRSEISECIGGGCGGYLDKLERNYALITRHRPYMQPETSRNVQYGLKDNFLAFWLRYVYKHRSAVEFGDFEYVMECVERDYAAYSRIMLEKYFRQKYRETGNYDIVVNYWLKGGRNIIDLIAVNEKEHMITIGQCVGNGEAVDVEEMKKRAIGLIETQPGWTFEYVGLSLEKM